MFADSHAHSVMTRHSSHTTSVMAHFSQHGQETPSRFHFAGLASLSVCIIFLHICVHTNNNPSGQCLVGLNMGCGPFHTPKRRVKKCQIHYILHTYIYIYIYKAHIIHLCVSPSLPISWQFIVISLHSATFVAPFLAQIR